MPKSEQQWNQQIIQEFRTTNGNVGGPFEGVPLLLLHSRDARGASLSSLAEK